MRTFYKIVIRMICSNKSKFSCDNYCGNLLPCGNHFCSKTCHSLKLPGSREESCEDYNAMPTGEEPVCPHLCPQKCYLGDCPRCKVLIKRSCHCGAMVHVFECLYYNPLSQKEQIAFTHHHKITNDNRKWMQNQ